MTPEERQLDSTATITRDKYPNVLYMNSGSGDISLLHFKFTSRPRDYSIQDSSLIPTTPTLTTTMTTTITMTTITTTTTVVPSSTVDKNCTNDTSFTKHLHMEVYLSIYHIASFITRVDGTSTTQHINYLIINCIAINYLTVKYLLLYNY